MNLQKVLINLMQKCLLYQNNVFIFDSVCTLIFSYVRYTENAYIFAFMLYFTYIYALKYLFKGLEYFLIDS